MRQLLPYFFLLFIGISFNGVGQKFNRSFVDPWGIRINAVVLNNSRTYLLQGPFAILKLNGEGELIDSVGWNNPNDPSVLSPYHMEKESDSTLLVFGRVVDAALPGPNGCYLARYDTTLQLLNYVTLPDSSGFIVDLAILNNNNIFFQGTYSKYLLDSQLNIVISHHPRATPNTLNITSVPLNNDSVLIQRPYDFIVYDLSNNTEYSQANSINPLMQNGYFLLDYNDSTFVIHSGRGGAPNPSRLLFFSKRDLSLRRNLNLDSLVGFPAEMVRTVPGGIFVPGKEKDFTFISEDNNGFNLYRDTLRSLIDINEVYPTLDIRDSILAIASRQEGCQTHLEVFHLDKPKAETFGGLQLTIPRMSSTLIKQIITEPRGYPDSAYAYDVIVDFDVNIINNSQDTLDSLTYGYGLNIPYLSCNALHGEHLSSLSLSPNDSIQRSFTDTVRVITYDSSSVNFTLGVKAVAANGNIVHPGVSDTAYQEFKGIGLKEYPAETHFSVYPSPAKDYLNLEISGGETIQKASVLTMDGRPLSKYNGNTPKMKISVSGLDRGLYLLHFQTDQSSYSKLFYKE